MSITAEKFYSRFVAIEGTDGSGKETTTKQIAEDLTDSEIEVEVIAFPRYQTPPGRQVRRYLDNKFGPAINVHHDLASHLYTVDRHLASDQIRRALTLGKFVIADRFTGSNMAFQGSKLADREQRRNFYRHLQRREFSEWQIPPPEFNFVLLVSESIAKVRRSQRTDSNKPLDGHEIDDVYQGRVAEAYEELCEIYPEWFIPIDCMKNGEQLPPDRIAELVLNKMEEVL